MTNEERAALAAGSPVGLIPPNSYELYGLAKVDRLTKTQIIIRLGTRHDGSPNELRFNRDSGYQIGSSSRWRSYSLCSIEHAERRNAEIKAERAHDALVSKVQELKWKFVRADVLEQVLALHAAATAKEVA